MKYPQMVKRLHQKWLLIRIPQNMQYWLMKQPPHQVRNMLLHPKSILSQRNICKGQKAAPKLVAKKSNTPKASALHDEGAMASDSDLDGEDYYIVEDDNDSASSEYVPCVNYPNDKVYPEDERMVGLGLRKILVPQIYIDLKDPVKTTWI